MVRSQLRWSLVGLAVVVVTAIALWPRGTKVVELNRDRSDREAEKPGGTSESLPTPATVASRQAEPDGAPAPERKGEGLHESRARTRIDPPIVRFVVLGPSGEKATTGVIRGVRGSRSIEGGSDKELEFDCGEVEFPNDHWTFKAFATSKLLTLGPVECQSIHDLSSDPVEVDLNLGDAPRDVVLKLVAHSVIYGKVRPPPSDRFAMVFCWRLKDGEALDEDHLWDVRPRRTVTEVNADEDRDGAYVLESLAPGRYAVAAGTDERVSPPTIVILDDHILKLDLNAPDGAQPGDLFVRAHGPGGMEFQELQFSVTSLDQDKSSNWTSDSVHPEPDGRYWLKLGRGWRGGPATASKGASHSTLRVTSRQFGTQTVELRRGQQEVDVYFQSPATVNLELNHYDSASVSARVTVIRFTYYDSGHYCETVQVPDDQPDASGHSSMTCLQPGRSVLGLRWTPQTNGQEYMLLRTTVELVSGANHVTMEIPQFFELTVSWRGSAFGTPVQVAVQSAENHDCFFGSNEESAASTRFDFVPAGSYDVTITGPEREVTRHVELQRSMKIDIVD